MCPRPGSDTWQEKWTELEIGCLNHPGNDENNFGMNKYLNEDLHLRLIELHYIQKLENLLPASQIRRADAAGDAAQFLQRQGTFQQKNSKPCQQRQVNSCR